MQSTCETLNCINVVALGLNGICPGQGNDEGSSSGWERKAQNGVLTTWENFTLRARHSYQPVASDWQSPVVRDPAR